MKEIFQINTPPLAFKLAYMFIQTLSATRVIIHSLPTVRGMGNLTQSKNMEPFKELKAIRILML